MPKLRLPSWLTITLSVLVGIGETSNLLVSVAQPWQTLITTALAFLAAVGIGPLVHGRLANVLHIPYQAALTLGAGLATVAVGLSTVAMDVTLRGIIVGVLTALGGMLVGPAPAKAALLGPVTTVAPSPGLKVVSAPTSGAKSPSTPQKAS